MLPCSGVLGTLIPSGRTQKGILDVPSIELAAGIVGGILLGSLFTAINAGLSALGDAKLQAIQEAGQKDASTAARVIAQRSAIVARLLVGRVLCLTLAGGFAGFFVLQKGNAWQAAVAVSA